MRTASYRTSELGFSLLEALLASSLLAIVLTAVTGIAVYGQQSSQVAGNQQRALELADEGLQATRSIRDGSGGFAAVTMGPHGVSLTANSQWQYSGTSDVNGIYTRVVTVATIDANRKSVVSTVTWAKTPQRNGSVSVSTYITNWTANQVGWALNGRTGTYNAAGAQDGLAIAVRGKYAYITRNASTPDFLVMDISTAAPTLVGSLTLGGVSNSIFIDGQYAYVTNTSNTQELKIINISNPAAPTLTGGYNTTGTADPTSVTVNNGTAYFTLLASADFEIYAVNVTNPAAPTLRSRLETGNNENGVIFLRNNLYIASANNTREVTVVNATNPAAMTILGGLDLAANTDATDIAGLGTTVYIGRGAAVSAVSITAPAAPTLISNYTPLGVVNDLALKDTANPLLIATAATGNEYEFVNVTNPAAMVRYSSFNMTGNFVLNGIAYSRLINKAVGVGSSDNEELTVVEPR